MKYDVFVSYRRSGGGKETARIITSELSKRGYKVFLDFNELKDSKFGPQIIEAIDSAPVFLFILSEGALDRCVNQDDWVRSEVMYAVEKNKHIIPVNPDGVFKTFPDGIPVEIAKALGDEQHSDIMMGQLFEKSIDKMVDERIEPFVQKSIFRKYCKAIILSAVLVIALVASFTGISVLKSERVVRADMELRNEWLSVAEVLAEGEDSLAVAYDYAVMADSLSDVYDGTRYEKRFGNQAHETLRRIEAKRDSVFNACSLGYSVHYDMYVRNKSQEDKAIAYEYILKALSAKDDSGLRMWRDILK